ncbi:putative NADPH-dependent methylglyoxal reductase Grp2p [[Candida] jaroonii]|uniref:NADPH-dependent methylglyoxal reductase Grp2p n=1 Tax=[Candida] jaroonii TaxID=467808 RepID=A0ACA9Y4K2_9ASCO|nr:putative NADPH-dependent methylglyoxal reductase Grp2p [[Candida] jaroonii]
MQEVFVSGASGYIAQNIVKLLISKGYKVIGTVRTAAKGEQLKKDAGENFDYEIVEDIGVPNAFDEALKKHPHSYAFLHTASPVTLATEDIANDIIKPAVEGTLNALKSIQKYGSNVKKVVITSSAVAKIDAKNMNNPDAELVTGDSWNPITDEEGLLNPTFGYFVAKRNAEKAAWDFVKNEKVKFSLNTIAPTLVIGPQAYASGVKETFNFSVELLNSLLKMKPDSKMPVFDGNFVDVRDVAKLHLHAFESDVENFCYLPITNHFSIQTCADIIRERFPSLRDTVPVGTPGTGKDLYNKSPRWDNKRTMAHLENPIQLEQSVFDTIDQIVNK